MAQDKQLRRIARNAARESVVGLGIAVRPSALRALERQLVKLVDESDSDAGARRPLLSVALDISELPKRSRPRTEPLAQEPQEKQDQQQQQQQQQQQVQQQQQIAYSIKVENIGLRPLASLRQGISGMSALGGAASLSEAIALRAAGSVLGVASEVGSLSMAIAAALLAAHYARRIDIRYDDACALVLAWRCSEYQDGRYKALYKDIVELIPLMESKFGVHGYNEDKLKNSLRSQESIMAISKEGDYYILHESIKIRFSYYQNNRQQQQQP